MQVSEYKLTVGNDHFRIRLSDGKWMVLKMPNGSPNADINVCNFLENDGDEFVWSYHPYWRVSSSLQPVEMYDDEDEDLPSDDEMVDMSKRIAYFDEPVHAKRELTVLYLNRNDDY